VCVVASGCIYVCERDTVCVWLRLCVFMYVREIQCVCGCVCVYLYNPHAGGSKKIAGYGHQVEG